MNYREHMIPQRQRLLQLKPVSLLQQQLQQTHL
jgi:hypothetical protein